MSLHGLGSVDAERRASGTHRRRGETEGKEGARGLMAGRWHAVGAEALRLSPGPSQCLPSLPSASIS